MENNTTSNQIPDVPVVQLRPVEPTLKNKISNFFAKFSPQRKTVGGIMGVLMLTASLGVGVYLARNIQNTRVQAAGMKISLSTSTQNPKVGDTLVVVVVVDTKGAQIAAADLGIKYDPNKIEAKKIEPIGDFLPTILIPEKLFSKFGRADISLGSLVNNSGSFPKSGTEILAQVTFEIKEAGTTEISFGANTRISAVGQNGDAIGEKKTLQITIGGSTSSATVVPEPTPEPSSTPQASPTIPSDVPTSTPITEPSSTLQATPTPISSDLPPAPR